MKNSLKLLLIAALGAGCNPTPEIDFRDSGTDTASDTAIDRVAPPDTSVDVNPDAPVRPRVEVSGLISSNTTWTASNIYVLTGGIVYVTNNAVLTIEAGTEVRGQVRDGTRTCTAGEPNTTVCDVDIAASNAERGCCPAGLTCNNTDQDTANDARCGAPREEGTALIVTRGARLEALGTRQAPVVFTSDNFGTATAPVPGDWGGVVLLGAAPTNVLPNPDQASIEGIPPTESRGIYGGNDTAHNCGTLRYVRIEYAGYRFGTNNELNSLTLGGCGTGTTLEYIQTHRGLDDGIEFFGGNARLRYAVVTGTGDDSLDYDRGFSGDVQFFIAQQRRVAGEDRCIEADGNASGRTNTPFTNPRVFNFTCIGAGYPGQPRTGANSSQDGFIFREGVAGTIRNSIVMSSPDRGVRIQHTETTARLEAGADPALVFSNNIVFDIGADGMTNFFDVDTHTGGTTGDAFETALLGLNRTVNPQFAGDVYSPTAPDFRPMAGGAATMQSAATPTEPSSFWTAAPYLGAVAPDATGDGIWYSGWTRFTE